MSILPPQGSQYNNEGQNNTEVAKSPEFFTGTYNAKEIPVDPFVSGYAFIKWVRIPPWVTERFPGFQEITEKNFRTFTGLDDLEVTALSVQGGFTASEVNFAGSITKPDGFTMSHNEFSGLPITRSYTYWVSSIRDPETGVATYPANHGLEYSARNHTGELFYIVTRPDANNRDNTAIIEFAAYYTNVLPTRMPMSFLNYTAGTNEAAPIEMSFFAQRHTGQIIEEHAQGLLSSLYDFQTAGDFTVNTAATSG